MSDRELLELAAKAARYPVRGMAVQVVSYLPANALHLVIGNERGGDSVWNPLTDDGDALRLAVKLNMNIEITDGGWVYACGDYGNCSEPSGDDKVAATRRAIVRAAAEIGMAEAASNENSQRGSEA